MKIPRIFVVIAATCLFVGEILAEQKLLVKHQKRRSTRLSTQTSSDQMLQNILQWLQGVYSQQNRRIRQDSLREYLPPSVTDKPRPFEPRPHGDGIDENGNFIDSGYPLPSTPQPPFHFATSPPVYSSTPAPDEYLSGSAGLSTLPPPSPPSGFQTQRPSSFPGYPTEGPYPYHPSAETTGYPSNPPIETERPSFSTVHPSYLPPQEPTGYPSVRPEGPSTSGEFPGFPTQRPPVPTQPPQEEVTPEHPAYPTAPPSEHPGYPSGHPTEHPGYPSGPPSEQPGYPTAPPQEFPGYPTASPPGVTPGYPTPPNPAFPSSPTTCYTGLSHRTPAKRYRLPDRISPGRFPTGYPSPSVEVSTGEPISPSTLPPGDNEVKGPTITDEDLKHPPHIHAIDVECSKEMMTINIEFNREFNGVIYSKGYYHMPECQYVKENSGQTKYTFTVNLNMCGTQFVNAFETISQSYLENVLVIQNEAGIQEIWDTIRSVRCLWEGSLKEQLSRGHGHGQTGRSVGRGAFGQPATGLVKIGEPMTLVVSVSGDPGFDIQVKDCRATDSIGDNVVPLTDDDGCVLKPKLFGAFQKTRNTGNTGASIIAFAYFNAFKFPDVMDLMIECNIELCKTDCEMCPNPDQALEPARRRRKRDLYTYNTTIHDGVMMGKHLRVVVAEDLAAAGVTNDGVCLSTQSFVFTSSVMISLLTASCLFSAYLWLRSNRQKVLKF
ncbi:hypothetical protein JTB14_023816 [Gonioctena quinquepunctata]|nr:hypothetical protein JTB14_023816 [Gonioctena quinquepunctata]